MKKHFLAIALIFVLLASILCACDKKSDILTQDEAVKMVAQHLNINVKDMKEVYVHVAEGEKNPSYSLHFSCNGKEYSLMVDVVTGEITEADH